MDDAVSNARLRQAHDTASGVESPVSAVCWPAIFAGAFVMAAATLVLLALGSGIGLAMVSPWPGSGASLTTFGIVTAIGLIVVQWLSAGLGGYVTGRLRTKWTNVHTHEVFFRDTANGLLAWALATVVGAFMLGSATSAAIGTGVHAAATVAGGAAQGAAGAATTAGAFDARGYDIDSLFRPTQPNATAASADVRTEATRILAKGLAAGDVPAADRTYLAQLVAVHTGLSEPDAQKRVDDVIASEKAAAADAKKAADTARKAATALSIFTALSMVIGAFCASTAAALGGRQRDEPAY
jgi:hypothetical protein